MLRLIHLISLFLIFGQLLGQSMISHDSVRSLLAQEQFPLVEQYLAHPTVVSSINASELDSLALRWLDTKADLFFETGRYSQAIELYQSLLPLYAEKFGKQSSLLAEIHSNLGITLGYSGLYDEAKIQYEAGLAITLAIYEDSDPNLAVSYINLGVFYERKGDYGLAKDYYEEALRIRKAHFGPQHERVADCYNNLGNIQYFLGDWLGARSYYQKSYDIYRRRLGLQNTNVGYACMNLAITYALEGKMEKAEKLFRQDLAIRQQVYGEKHPLTAYCYDNLGQLYQMQNKLGMAFQHYTRSLEISKAAYGENHPFVAQTYGNLAKLALSQNDSTGAEGFYHKALGVLGLYDGQNWTEPSHVKDGPKALRMIQELFQLQAQRPSLRQEAWESLQFADQLVDYFRTSYRAEGSQLFLQGSIVPFYESGIIFCQKQALHTGDQSYLSFALKLSEQTSAVLLSKAIKQSEALNHTEIPDSLLSLEKSTRTLLEFYDRQLKSTQEEDLLDTYQAARFQQLQIYDSIQGHLEAHYPRYYQRKNQMHISSIEEIRMSLLEEDESLVEYFVGDSNLFTFLLNPDTLILIQQTKLKGLAQQISELRQAIYGYFVSTQKSDSLYRQGLIQYQARAYELYQILISPIEAQLNKNMMIVPQGELGYVPFEVLLKDQVIHLQAIGQYPFLIKERTISYAFSVNQLLAQRQLPPVKSKELLAVRPSFSASPLLSSHETERLRNNLGPLPYAAEEVANIQAIWPGPSTVIEEQEANIDRFRQLAGSYGILHIATHAQADDKSRASERAFLAFQPNDSLPDAHFLYFNELPLLDLDADLVVLSACETGIGRLYEGEGIASLARGFTQAGARSILTTLWSVNDAQSSKLMGDFYRYLALGIDKDKALQKARMRYLSRADDFYSHPFFWGAYIAIGDMSTVGKPGGSSPWLLAFLAIGLSILAIWFARSMKLG